jgi:hypothetical protein
MFFLLKFQSWKSYYDFIFTNFKRMFNLLNSRPLAKLLKPRVPIIYRISEITMVTACEMDCYGKLDYNKG